MRLTGAVLVGLMAGCSGGGEGSGGVDPLPPPPPGLSPAVTVSSSGDLTLEQYDRSAKASAVFARSSRFTLIPEGATP